MFTHCQDVGRVNIRVAEPFDQVKVAVKRGEIDWLHIVPEGSWCNLDRVITRVVKLCRVSPQWDCRKAKSLFDEDEVRVVSAQSSQVLTNVGCWDVETNINTLVENFSRFINKAVGTHPAEVTITMDGATGVGLQKSLRNAVRSVAKLPGWSLVGVKVASIVEQLVGQNEGKLEQVLDSLGDKTKSCCVPETLCAQLRQRLGALLSLNNEQLQPGPGGLFPGVVQGLTEAAQDPDVHIHEWLRGHQNSTGWRVRRSFSSECGKRERPHSLCARQSVG